MERNSRISLISVILFICMVMLFTGSSYAVIDPLTPVWTATASGDGRAVAVDAGGNVLVAGAIPNVSVWNYLVIKYDASGNPIWSRTYDPGVGGGYLSGIATDAGGNVYVTGTVNYGHCLTVKYDPSGTLLWTATYAGSYSGAFGDYCNGITVDQSGNVYVVGATFSGYSYDFLVIKYDTNGNEIWLKTYDSNAWYDYGYRIALDTAGYIYATGRTGSGGKDNCLTMKLDPFGNAQWAKIFDSGLPTNSCGGIAVDNETKDVYFTGAAGRDFSPYKDYDIYTVKYDKDGNEVWVRPYGGSANEYGSGVALDSKKNVYVAGYGNGNLLTLKYDPLGNLLWTSIYDRGATEQACGITIDNADFIYIEGWHLTDTYNALTVKFRETDADGDGSPFFQDCNDSDPTIYPGAPEVKHDGIDQDCNGYDLTIDIWKAVWSKSKRTLTVEATSGYSNGPNTPPLNVDGYGSMAWNRKTSRWAKTVSGVTTKPETVTVSGNEGSENSIVTQTK